MTKDLGITLCEDMGGFTTGGLAGGAIGAGIGVFKSVREYLQKKAELEHKMSLCKGDPSCMEKVKAEIRSVRAIALRSGLGKGLAGAAVGGTMGAAVGSGVQMGKGLSNMNLAQATGAENLPGISQPAQRAAATIDAFGNVVRIPAVMSGLYQAGSPESTRELNQYITGK